MTVQGPALSHATYLPRNRDLPAHPWDKKTVAYEDSGLTKFEAAAMGIYASMFSANQF